MNERKIFIIDTSVLLYDRNSIHSFPENDVLLPLVVLDELDRFKDKKGLVGENARYINRYLDNLRKQGSLHKGIEIENGRKFQNCCLIAAESNSKTIDDKNKYIVTILIFLVS